MTRSRAGLQFCQAHGRFVAVSVGRLLAGRWIQFEDDHRRPAPQGAAGENAPLGPMEPQWRDTAEAGDVQRAADRIDPLGRRQHVESHPGDRIVRRHALEIDACQLAGRAGAAVGADEILRPQLVVTIGPADVHGDAVGVLVEAGKPVPPANVGLVLDGPLRERLNQLGLLDGEHEHLRIRHQREVQGEGRKHRARRALRRPLRSRERAVQTAVVQNPNPLAHNAIGAGLRIGARHRIQHHGPDPGQPQLSGEHQSIRTASRDGHVNHCRSLSPA